MDWNLKGKGRTPHKDDKAASDYGVKQVVLQEEPGDSNNDFTNHQRKNDHRNPGDVPFMIIDKFIGRYASQSGVDNNLNEPDENKKPPADGNVKDVNKCQHASRGRIRDEISDHCELATTTFSICPLLSQGTSSVSYVNWVAYVKQG